MRSPFKFLDSYNREDASLFYGREKEVEELYTRVFESKLLLVYGPSGSGKSSLINCGLANKFMEADWLPIFIRKSENIVSSMVGKILEHALTPVKVAQENNRTIHKLLQSVFLDHFKPIYLVFDQFEELFLLGRKTEWIAFIELIEYLKETELNLHFVFIIRGEYLEYLSEFEDTVPEFFDNRLRIEKMTRNNASRCIDGPAEVNSIKVEEGFSEALLKKLSPDSAEVELTYLQVFLDRIFQMSLAERNGTITFRKSQIEALGQVSDVLEDFIEEQIFQMSDPRTSMSLLKIFVSLQGTKAQLTIHEAFEKTVGMGMEISRQDVHDIIQELVNRRVLKDQDTSGRFELRHDSLAQKVFDKITLEERARMDVIQLLSYSLNEHHKRGTYLSESDLDYIAPYEKALKLDPTTSSFIQASRVIVGKSKGARRRLYIVISIIVGLLLVAITGVIYTEQQKRRAEQMASLAGQESENARLQKEIADNQRKLAELKSEEALIQARIADEQRVKAEELQRKADQQRSIAQDEKAAALIAKIQAQQAQTVSEQNAELAIKEKNRADLAKQEALKLRMLELSRTLSIKSRQVNDPNLKMLLAKQAFNFHEKSGVQGQIGELYRAMYQATKIALGEKYNIVAGLNGSARAMAVNDGRLFVASGNGLVGFWPLNSLVQPLTVIGNSNEINLALFASRDEIIVGSDEGNIHVYRDSGKYQFKAHEGGISFVQMLGDQKIISASRNGTLKTHRLNGGDPLEEISFDAGVSSAVFDQEEVSLYVGLENGKLISMNSELKQLKNVTSFSAAITSLKRISGQQLVIGLENGSIRLYSLVENKELMEFSGHTSQISDLNYIESKDYLVSTSYDRSVRVWNLSNHQKAPIIISDHNGWLLSTAATSERFWVSNIQGEIRSYELNLNRYSEALCNNISTKLTEEEWAQYVAENISQSPTCIK